jgi:hypothetical protein
MKPPNIPLITVDAATAPKDIQRGTFEAGAARVK